MRYTPSGAAVTQFTLAVDRPFKGPNGESEADFLPIVTWRQLAESCANYLRKGRLCAVEGRIQTRNYENNEGRRIYITEIIADNVRFLESQNAGNRTPRDDAPPDGGGRRDPFGDDGKPIDISDDDLPF
jgi:single-strand DNA-binding protein